MICDAIMKENWGFNIKIYRYNIKFANIKLIKFTIDWWGFFFFVCFLPFLRHIISAFQISLNFPNHFILAIISHFVKETNARSPGFAASSFHSEILIGGDNFRCENLGGFVVSTLRHFPRCFPSLPPL